MKTLKTIICTFLFFAFVSPSGFAKADDTTLTLDHAIKTYIEAVSLGKIKGLDEVLDKDVKFTVSQGNKVLNYNKTEMLNSMKGTEDLCQNCKTDFSIIERGDAQSIVKVTMIYETFSKVNFVTISNTHSGWKITNVSSSFN